MQIFSKTIFSIMALVLVSVSFAQSEINIDLDGDFDGQEQLKLAALEALMSAPPERSLPLVSKVLAGNHSDEVKSRALFILSQIALPEAQEILLDTAINGTAELRSEAIRMIGISGDTAALAGLSAIFDGGDRETRESVLQAYLIAGDSDAVYEIAANAGDDDEFEMAVHMLGVMRANDKLRLLRGRDGNSESLIHAYAIAGDSETLRSLALDSSNPERQIQAIHGLGFAGDADAAATLMEIYRNTDSAEVKQSALQGLLVAGHEDGVIELFRSSDDAREKRDLLRTLVMMDSDAALEIIDETLGDGTVSREQ